MPDHDSTLPTMTLEAAAPAQKRRPGMPMLLVSAILLLQIALFYSISTSEFIPQPPALRIFPNAVGSWRMARETELQTDVLELLKADDTLNRDYSTPGAELNLFVAFFKTQRAGVTPHSPKVCLPGSGWVPENSRTLSLTVPGADHPIPVNRYSVARGENRSLVYYWYQTAHRVVANEYMAKMYLMLDSLRYRRSDTALVRVVVPVRENGVAEADRRAVEFINLVYAPLKRQIWND